MTYSRGIFRNLNRDEGIHNLKKKTFIKDKRVIVVKSCCNVHNIYFNIFGMEIDLIHIYG